MNDKYNETQYELGIGADYNRFWGKKQVFFKLMTPEGFARGYLGDDDVAAAEDLPRIPMLPESGDVTVSPIYDYRNKKGLEHLESIVALAQPNVGCRLVINSTSKSF